ncbi:MAG: SBBP repeat-containing protein [Bacteroidota bacterium]|nr:SBBP repeat-containing protein [Bacteroidota bacterium]
MNIKSKFIILLFLIIHLISKGQEWQWVEKFGGNSYDLGRSITTDRSQNIYIIGTFQNQATFGKNIISSYGGSDIFVLKINQNGKIILSKKIGGHLDDYGKFISTDKYGNFFITGSFQDTAYFDNSIIVSKGKSDAFLAKYNSEGLLIWVKKLGSSENGEGKSIYIDFSGNCYVTGNFSGSINCNNEVIKNKGKSDIFVTKIDKDGIQKWVRNFGYPGKNSGESISGDLSGNIFITGIVDSTIYSGNFTISSIKSHNLERDIYISKYNSNGQLLWYKICGGQEDNRGLGISNDSTGNCYVTGYFSGMAKFDTTEIYAVNGWDIFLAKFNTVGKLIWIVSEGGERHDYSSSVCNDKYGNCYITGGFMKSIEFGKKKKKGNKGWNCFVAKYDTNGAFKWVESIESNKDSYSYGICMDVTGNCYITGSFSNSVKFGSKKLNTKNDDIFVARLKTKISNSLFKSKKEKTKKQNKK